MKTTLNNLIESISYSDIDVSIETPIARSHLAMEVDHITESDKGYYIEGMDGQSLELLAENEIDYSDGEYTIQKDDCHICIKLNI